MKLKLLTFVLVFASSGNLTVAQRQDQRDQYQLGSLSQIIKENSKAVASIDVGLYMLFKFDGVPSSVPATYMDKSRKLDPTKKEFMSEWAKARVLKQEMMDEFEEELLFVEDSVEYWLPVHKRLVPYFKQRLKKGEKIELLTLWIGARKEKKQVDWIFLVTDVKKS